MMTCVRLQSMIVAFPSYTQLLHINAENFYFSSTKY